MDELLLAMRACARQPNPGYMATRLTHRDLAALSTSIQVPYESCDLEGFPRHVFAAISPLVRCDLFSYNEFARDGARSDWPIASGGFRGRLRSFYSRSGRSFQRAPDRVSRDADWHAPAV